jgi:hypothetical protein
MARDCGPGCGCQTILPVCIRPHLTPNCLYSTLSRGCPVHKAIYQICIVSKFSTKYCLRETVLSAEPFNFQYKLIGQIKALTFTDYLLMHCPRRNLNTLPFTGHIGNIRKRFTTNARNPCKAYNAIITPPTLAHSISAI